MDTIEPNDQSFEVSESPSSLYSRKLIYVMLAGITALIVVIGGLVGFLYERNKSQIPTLETPIEKIPNSKQQTPNSEGDERVGVSEEAEAVDSIDVGTVDTDFTDVENELNQL